MNLKGLRLDLRLRVDSLWNGSIRRQLALTFSIALSVMMIVAVLSLLFYQRTVLYRQSTENALGLAQALAASSTSWVLASDLAGLQEVVEGMASTPDLRFAAVLTTSAEVLASTQPRQVGQVFSDAVSRRLLNASPSPQILIDDPALLDVAMPVMAGTRHVGWVRIELTRAAANAILQHLQWVGLGFSLLALALIVLLANLLAERLTRRLTHLMAVIEAAESGQKQLRATPRGNDEIDILAQQTNRMLDALAVQRADLQIAAITFESQQGMVVTDAQQRILRVNRAFTAMTGYSADESIGKLPGINRSGRHDTTFYAAMWDELARSGSWQGEIWNRHKNGLLYPVWLTITAVKDDSGAVTHYVGTYLDITARKQAEEEIRFLAFYDPLTGLPNRRLQHDRLQQALIASRRSGQHGAVLFIDLDNFKSLNDTLGHDMGDVLLQEVASRLTACVRQGDTVARLGGDEFVVMLENLDAQAEVAADQARQLGEKILARLNQPYDLRGQAWHNTPSIGITVFGAQSAVVDELLKQADLAMYQAKNSGRNTLRFFDQEMQRVVFERVDLIASLRIALQERRFVLHYQPQVERSGRVIGAEALVRWQHPQRDMIPPAEFIPAMEESGLIVPLGSWVLEEACRQLAAWAARPEMRHLVVAVNISVRQFAHPEFVEQVISVIEKSKVAPRQIKLELTESLLVTELDETIVKMTELKSFGVGFTLDDFGTGYSSLAYLKRLPLDQLKIDQSFIRDVLVDTNDAVLVNAIIALGQSLGLQTIAEGVETIEQQEFLAHQGCAHYQGYLFGRPLPAAAFAALVLERNALPARVTLIRS